MSGSQSPLTDRSPCILPKDHPPDKKAVSKSDKSITHEFDPTGLVQRCVIIQKDENGFGLTVSGDNPVFVQLVKEDGAAMRAGVQTGDRIIKVNGTLVTSSNHTEVVKLIKSGSYVALTVLGRPPGLVPLEAEVECEGGEAVLSLSPAVSHSPGLPGSEQGSPLITHTSTPTSTPTSGPRSPQDHITSPLPLWEDNKAVHNQKVDILQKMLTKEQQDLQAMKEEYSRSPRPKLLKDIQEAKKHIPLLQEQLRTAGTQDGAPWPRDVDAEEGEGEQSPPSGWDSGCDGPWTNNNNNVPGSPLPGQRESCHSPKTPPRDPHSCPSPDSEDTPDLDSNSQCSLGSPSTRLHSQIIGAEDDYFDTQQEQISGHCSCFQSIELLKSRPAHLAAVLHHVVSQFDPAPLLCYLYADLYKHTSSKDTRRLFMDLHSFFMDRAANLKVPVPDSIATELERRRLELIPEELCRQYTQLLQDTLLPDILRNLEDFRQKRSMGLTLAEGELSKLEPERVSSPLALEKERSCAEHIISKIEDILFTSQSTEEEKCSTMQFVILTYMKHLGVKVKEPRSLEPKRVRINFLPKIKKSIKAEKEGEEKVKRPRFPSILGPPRRPSRVDSTSISKAMDMNKQRPQKQLSQPAVSIPEHHDSSSPGRLRSNHSSDGSDASACTTSPPHSAPAGQVWDHSGHDSDSGVTPSSVLPRKAEGVHPGDGPDGTLQTPSTHFDFSPCTLEQLHEVEREAYRMEGLGVGPPEAQSEDEQAQEVERGQDPLNWQQLVSQEVLARLTPHEIKRQEVINELFYTERAHLRMLKVLDYVFYQRLSRDSILPPGDIKHIFTNLDEIIQLHVSITEQMTAIRKNNETSVIDQIGNDLLTWFSGGEEGKIQRAVGTFCSNQPSALELIKNRQKKDQRFTSFIQEAESNRMCRRLQLKDIIPVEMQRLTKYPLFLDNIAKFTEDSGERDKVRRAAESCKKILNHVNQAVKEAENKQRLEDYQRRLDLSSLKQSENPMISEFKNLDLTKRKMVHEGPLSWKVNKDKTIELYTLLLEDILVLLQKQDERLVLKCHSKNLAGSSDTKHIFSPIIKLNTVLVRSVATDNKSFFVLSMSDNGAQIYELMAQTVSEQRTWQCLITQRADTMKTKPHNIIPLSQTDAERDAIDIINTEEPKLSKDPECTSAGSVQSADGIPGNPFDEEEDGGEDEEESPLTDGGGGGGGGEEEEEEVDEEEVEAFLDGELADRLPFLQERSRQAIAMDDQELSAFGLSPSRAEEALRTLAALKQVLLNHLMAREEAEKAKELEKDHQGDKDHQKDHQTEKDHQKDHQKEKDCLLRTNSLRGPENGSMAAPAPPSSAGPSPESPAAGREDRTPEVPSGDTGFFDTLAEDCGGDVALEGSGGSGTDDDGGGGGGEGIDLTKLLSSSSQPGGSGPNLNRQVMTHLRLLQASLHHLKEVETKYNELRQNLSKTATDEEESNDKV